MSLIRKPSEFNVPTTIKALIYGQAGMGKTTMGVSAPKPLLIDCDNGVHRINIAHQVDAVQVTSYDDVLSVLKEDLSAYESLVIDTGGKLLDFMAFYIIKNNPKMGKANGSLTLQGFGERKAEFIQFCKLVSHLNKHLIFLAHRETSKDGDNTRYTPLFGGSSYDTLVTELDLVGYLEANGRKRTITFDPTDRNDGKNTCNLPATMEVPMVIDQSGNGLPNTFLTDIVIATYQKNLDKRKQATCEFDKVMEEIKENITCITDAESANDFVSRIDAFDHVGTSKKMAGTLLAKRAKELNLKLNKTTKKYESA